MVDEVAEVAELPSQRRRPRRRRLPRQLMVTHLPLQQPLREVPVVAEAVVDAVLHHPQPQLTVPWLRLFLRQQADAVAEVEVLRPLQWKSFRRLPKARWPRPCKRQAVLEFSGPRKVRATPSNTLIEFHLRMAASALFLRRIGGWEIGVISGGSPPALPCPQTLHSPYLNFA